MARERPTATRSSSGSSARICCGVGGAAAEALEQAPVDRARRAHRQLLADDRAHERARTARRAAGAARAAPRSSSSRASTGSAARRCAQAVYAWPSTAPGTPVFVEYFGWIFISGPDVVHGLRRRRSPPRAKPVAMSLSLPSKVVMSPHAHTRSSDVLNSAVDADRALLDLEAPLLQRPERGLEPELQQDRVARDLDDLSLVLGVEELHALDRRRCPRPRDLVGHVEVDAAPRRGRP